MTSIDRICRKTLTTAVPAPSSPFALKTTTGTTKTTR